MGETLQRVTPSFNRSLRIESRTDRLTGDPGAVVLREILERSGILGWMTARLKGPRSQVDVTHDLASLIRTCVLLSAQGWPDHDDADALRHDPAFRLAASSAAGLTPLGGPGLASQPTLSRFTALMAEPANLSTAAAALEAFSRQMKRLPREVRRSMTYDRGSEMACHPELARRLKIDIWFCDPHAPWQRGSNENTNGLLRQFMPKGTDLSEASQTWLNDVARLMNGRPRKTLGWKTPAEAMAEEIKAFTSTVALDV
jgi:hypothetical protein